ncbi:sulfotransferase [Xanthomonas hydrangeae]|uniref:Sulfotransferase n=1 Tax=Xanthomonas hydrangeae TaxID=2775159 RepID=A0AAU0BGB7_9XANT|nr:sulfotransferase [Xanthomonas hydrangeae]WOB51982.1 sulfotransferase [Xanthomonas hydrangeae]
MTETQLRALLRDGYQLLRQGRYADAIALADRACADQPDNAHLLEFASEARLANGDPYAAAECIASAAAVASSPLPLLIKYASLLIQLRRRREATLVARQAQALAAADGNAWWRIGALYSGCQDVAAARDAYQQALTLLGDQPSLLYDLATMQFFGGEFDAAEVTVERLLQLAPTAGDALYLRATLRRQTGQHNHLDDLRHRLATTLSEPSARAAGLYALAKELEDLGQHAQSFETLTTAAACKRKTLQYDVTAECAHIAAVRQAYAADALRTLRPGHDGEGVIFIVGLPRSGTTLLERLLIQRGGARSAGELMDFGAVLGSATSGVMASNPGLTAAQASLKIDFAAVGKEYLRGAREVVHGHPVLIDKMPVNYLYCGMIATALTRARIIHLVRDPLDTCYAIYKTLFYNAYPFSYALDELGDYYLAYQQTMRHWHSVLPEKILDVHYEDLVRDTEHQITRVLTWCGLSSNENTSELKDVAFVTASAAQVRGEVHQRSVHSSRRHLNELAPLMKRLQAAGVSVS